VVFSGVDGTDSHGETPLAGSAFRQTARRRRGGEPAEFWANRPVSLRYSVPHRQFPEESRRTPPLLPAWSCSFRTPRQCSKRYTLRLWPRATSGRA